MNNDNMLLKRFSVMYYTDLIMWFVELVVIIFGLLLVRNQRFGRLFLLYLAIDFMVLNISFYFVASSQSLAKLDGFLNYANPSISLLELYIYYQYFLSVVENDKRKKILKILLNLFTLLLIGFFLLGTIAPLMKIRYLSYAISVVEFIFICLACIFYFLQLLLKESPYHLFQRPSFWIVTGIFVFAVISIPYYLLNTYLDQTRNVNRHILVALFYNAPFTINFLFLLNAFLCRKCLTI